MYFSLKKVRQQKHNTTVIWGMILWLILAKLLWKHFSRKNMMRRLIMQCSQNNQTSYAMQQWASYAMQQSNKGQMWGECPFTTEIQEASPNYYAMMCFYISRSRCEMFMTFYIHRAELRNVTDMADISV